MQSRDLIDARVCVYRDLCVSQFQPRAPPPPPRANLGHLLHDESRGPGIWQLIVLIVDSAPPGICKQQKTGFVISCCHFKRRSESRVSSSQALSFWSRSRASNDHKRPIKAKKHLFCLFSVGVTHFVTCFMQFY